MGEVTNSQQQKKKIVIGDDGYVLEDVPHLSDYIPNLPVRFLYLYLSLIFRASIIGRTYNFMTFLLKKTSGLVIYL